VTFLDEIKARAVAQGISAAVIFLSSMTVIPVGAGPYLLLRETGGSGPERTQNVTAGAAYQRPGLQYVAVASTYAAARTLARAFYDAMIGVRNQELSGTWYREIIMLQEPFDLGPDATNRAQVAGNVTAIKRPS
jgi:hypothetical protein